jgi:hypothetical protein
MTSESDHVRSVMMMHFDASHLEIITLRTRGRWSGQTCAFWRGLASGRQGAVPRPAVLAAPSARSTQGRPDRSPARRVGSGRMRGGNAVQRQRSGVAVLNAVLDAPAAVQCRHHAAKASVQRVRHRQQLHTIVLRCGCEAAALCAHSAHPPFHYRQEFHCFGIMVFREHAQSQLVLRV